MLIWGVFIVVATLNLILGIAIAVWMRREIISNESRAESSELGVFSDVTPSTLQNLAPEPAEDTSETSLSEKPATFEPDLPATPAPADATSEPKEEKEKITEVFGLSAQGDGHLSDSSGALDPGTGESNPPDFPDSDPVENGPTVSRTDGLTDLAPTSAENCPSGNDASEASAGTEGFQDETGKTGGTLGVTHLVETCSQTISELIAVFEQIRSQTIPTGKELHAVQTSIVPVMEQFLEEYRQVLPSLVSTEQGGPILEETLACLQEHLLAANQSLERLSLIDHRGDPQATIQQAFAELARLISRVQRVRDELEAAFAQSLLNPQAGGEIDEKIQRDPLTGLWNRTGVEVFFDKNWGSEQHRRTALSGALLDLDQFRQVNQQYGYALGDQLLKAMANLLQDLVPRGAFLARYRGDQFLVLKPEWDSRQFVRAVEQIRQSLEVAKFHFGSQTITVTITCGVTESRTDDVVTSFCERLDEAVYEAKRAGGNRTFVHNGEHAQSIVPHNLKVTEREVSVATVG